MPDDETVPDPAAEAQATALIHLLEANGCVLHGEWYPEPGAAKLRYTRRSENHAQMWVIDVRPWAGWDQPRMPGPDNQGAAWTVGQLRRALEGLPGDLPVEVVTAGDDEQAVTGAEPWAHTEGPAADVRARIATGDLRPSHFEISLGVPDA